MAFNPHSTYRGDQYLYGGFAGLGAGIADAIKGWRARENENAELGSYLAAVGLPQEQIDGMNLAQRRGMQKALDFKMKQNYQTALQNKLESENAYRGAQTDLAMLGLDSKRKQAEAGTAALDMLGANYRDYAETPQYLRNPEYDPVSASMEQAMSSGNMGAAFAIRDFMASRKPQFEFHEGPGGAVGWSYGKQAGVSMPKAASSGAEGSEYASSYGKMIGDAQKLEAAGLSEDAQMLKSVIAAKAAMNDGIDDRTLMMLNFTNPDLAQQIIRQRLNRSGGVAESEPQPYAPQEDKAAKAANLLGL